MSATNRPWRFGSAACLAALALSVSAWAHGPDFPGKIEFLPPPMDGTISLGIYNDAGKLVRVLHHDAEITELTAGIDGLITRWDGKDDQGNPCPSGTYRARGVMVGDLGVEGVDFIGNDWVTENHSARVRRITGLGATPNGDAAIAATLAGQEAPANFTVSLKPAETPGEPPETVLQAAPGGPTALNTTADGDNHAVWKIEGEAVKLTSKKGGFFTLPAQAGDPIPVALATGAHKLFVLYANPELQRLRGYDFTGLKPGAAPKELFENDIWTSDRFEQIAGQLKFPDGKPFIPSPEVSVTLPANPLINGKVETLRLKAGVDKEGSYIGTADGLPLCHISESKGLLWAQIGQVPGNKAVLLFDSDGSVVEEFQIAAPARMLTFDAGSIQWIAAAPSPEPSASATPAPSPNASPGGTPLPAEATPSPASTPTVTPAPAPEAATPDRSSQSTGQPRYENA